MHGNSCNYWNFGLHSHTASYSNSGALDDADAYADAAEDAYDCADSADEPEQQYRPTEKLKQ